MFREHLSMAAEVALILEVRARGARSSHAWSRLEEAFKPLINSFANRVGCKAFERPEVEQAMRLAFFAAVSKHDVYSGDRLASLVYHYLNGAVHRTRKQLQRKEESLEALVEQSEKSGDVSFYSDLGLEAEAMAERVVVYDDVVPAVRQFVHDLPPAQQRLALRMMDYGENEAEAAEHFGISRQAASKTWLRIVKTGRDKLQAFA